MNNGERERDELSKRCADLSRTAEEQRITFHHLVKKMSDLIRSEGMKARAQRTSQGGANTRPLERFERILHTTMPPAAHVVDYDSRPIARLLHTTVDSLRREMSGCGSVLDCGCGESSPLEKCDVPFTVGVDIYRPALEVDLARCEVVALFRGDSINSCGLRVGSVTEDGDTVVVRFDDISFQTMSSGGKDGGDRVVPYAFIILPKSEKTIVLEENVQSIIGGPPQWKSN